MTIAEMEWQNLAIPLRWYRVPFRQQAPAAFLGVGQSWEDTPDNPKTTEQTDDASTDRDEARAIGFKSVNGLHAASVFFAPKNARRSITGWRPTSDKLLPPSEPFIHP